jgi:triosephosphate isomerase
MIIAANLKTNLTRSATHNYMKELQTFVQNKTQEVIVFPATSSFDCYDTTATIGAQSAYPVEKGAFTGEIGLQHLAEFNIKTILIGHSERRHILGESQEFIAKKFEYFKGQGFKIIYCVGEPLEIRERSHEEMLTYIHNQFEGIDTDYENLIIAYEPVWAIGTGKVPTFEDIQNIHKELKKKSSAPLLYGGSVKVNNVKEILKVENVDGVLVGSAALYVEHFCSMIQAAEELEKK